MQLELKDMLGYCSTLPSMPGIALQVLELGKDPDVNPRRLADLIGNDPALASRILRVSNSPLYGQHRKSDNLQQAVMALGLNATMSLALSFSLVDTLRSSGAHAEALNRTWRRALIAGATTRVLAEALRMPRQEELFLAAMLQDIGILALNAALPDQYPDLLASSTTHDDLLALERETLATDHGQAGAWLMNHWSLPELLVCAATGSHDPDAESVPDAHRDFLRVVAVASRIADLFVGGSRRQADAAEVVQAADRWLGMERDLLEQVLADVADSLPEVERVFETQLAKPQQVAAVMEQARELLTMRNLQLIQQAAEHQRRVKEMERNSRRWQEEASRDALTGLYNRRFFDERLEREFAFASEQGLPLVLGFMDLDHFKAVNDEYGHETGDKVLMSVAETLREHTRDGDLVVRYGGEEFVILLPDTSLHTGLRIFERLRRAIEGVEYASPDGRSLHITVSIGIAAHMDAMASEQSQVDLVRQADKALYTAKKLGRNRVESAVA
ncbi:diguanylate cyclase (GGDEF)-like protein [Natronocella acetinitrilica]|uniref:diguanylate cyclase n=1 Tax=Natronocella acetinitrilica TaxID=414046 RepID=A0AAE3KHN7_9GAMM|nr:GGDEF domain-containing protein [Natronocella acetinitrilica]MCP1676537.1 diguanylate cyclase (GGDEF)-like protein [Natronocella acetinitrilica]